MKIFVIFLYLSNLLLHPMRVTDLNLAAQQTREFYVAVDGRYENPGTINEPTTLTGARDKIRAISASLTGTTTVYLRGGVYELDDTFQLQAQDSGKPNAPIVYRAYQNEVVRISGGSTLNPDWFSQVKETSPVWSRVNPSARGKLYQVNLSANGIEDFGILMDRGIDDQTSISGLELAFNGNVMELARWPNRNHTDPFNRSLPAVVSGNLSPNVTGTYDYIGESKLPMVNDGYPIYRRNGLVDGKQYFLYHCTHGEGNQHKYWFISTSDPTVSPDCWPKNGASWVSYADTFYPIPLLEPFANSSGTALVRTQPVDYIDNGFVRVPQRISDTQFLFPGDRYKAWDKAGQIMFQGLFGVLWADDTVTGSIGSNGIVQFHSAPSYGIKENQPFAVLNLLEELDTPGEWFMDRGTGALYFWPPSALANSDIMISRLEVPLVMISGAKNISFIDITFELSRAELVKVSNGEAIHFSNCEFRNAGAAGIKLNGRNNSIKNSRVYNTGAEGIALSGGNRVNLEPGSNIASHNDVNNFGRWQRTYHPGVFIYGVGNTVVHNKIHNSPHSAIILYGNNHTIQYNEIFNVVQETRDAGAIYAGRDWGFRGNSIAYNFIHHVNSVFGGSHAIYMDDAVSGFTVTGNILYQINGFATVNGGGRDNVVTNNIMVNTMGGHTVDKRAVQLANYSFHDDQHPDSWNLLGRLNVDYVTFYSSSSGKPVIDYQHGAWAEQYPKLAAIPNDWQQVNGSHWLAPEGNVFSCNIAWNAGPLLLEGSTGGTGALNHYDKIEANITADPLFVDEQNLNMNLKANSPAYNLPCFNPIPFELIGNLADVVFSEAIFLPLISQ